ncbi:WD40/YVTN/BNR-like repeat-containing protein [Paenibacillus aestuarii]|uniref:YCF48-related protein n=1 Tax=Paenibacillus aestuarii TaxID=516965 RepID=A0ABW0K641_9BACL|nr:YCF48-related protein [Paenibacillus aestuarii]
MALTSKKRLVLFLLFLFILIGLHRVILPKWPVIGEFHKRQPAVELSVSQAAAVTVSGDGQAGQANDQQFSKPTDSVVFTDDLQGFALDSRGEALSLAATNDGGVTWQQVHRFPHTTGEEHLAFLNPQTGWLLSGPSSDRKPELQLTSDGGKTWEVIAGDLPGFDTMIARISFFRFFDRQNGLIAVQADQDMVLLRTQDGGLTWSASSRIALPRQLPGVLAFTTPNDGWLVNGSGAGDQAAILYRMTDGERWQSAGKLPERMAAQAISFADAQTGGILLHAPSAEASWQLLRTQNGGSTWSMHAFRAGIALGADVQMSFTSSSIGWLQSRLGFWRTNDGGLSWARQEL